MAADNATIKSTFFHPEHLLARRYYSQASTPHSCAACELTVTGAGYSCDECGFYIHEACLSLPLRVDFDGHPAHHLTLTRLQGATSRRCDACLKTSGAGRYMYLCAACNYDVHPRCTSLVAQQGDRRRRSKTRTVIKVGVFGLRVVDDVVTGGLMSPVLDFIDAAVGN